MKITTLTNDEIVIQARNQKDFEEAQKVADEMVEIDEGLVPCSMCEHELWIQLAVDWNWKRAHDLKDLYQSVKKDVVAAR